MHREAASNRRSGTTRRMVSLQAGNPQRRALCPQVDFAPLAMTEMWTGCSAERGEQPLRLADLREFRCRGETDEGRREKVARLACGRCRKRAKRPSLRGAAGDEATQCGVRLAPGSLRCSR